jgi:dynein heavy chain
LGGGRLRSHSVSFLLVPFPCRFITSEDEQWFNINLIRAIEENISPEAASCILPEPYFVDFLRDMPEPTGDEPEDTLFEVPKIYELVSIFIS